MDVILVKKAVYNLTTDKVTPIPGDVFQTLMLTGDVPDVINTEALPRVIMFENKDSYLTYGEDDIDYSKDVYVSKKGQIFCFLKDAADTEENTGDETGDR